MLPYIQIDRQTLNRAMRELAASDRPEARAAAAELQTVVELADWGEAPSRRELAAVHSIGERRARTAQENGLDAVERVQGVNDRSRARSGDHVARARTRGGERPDQPTSQQRSQHRGRRASNHGGKRSSPQSQTSQRETRASQAASIKRATHGDEQTNSPVGDNIRLRRGSSNRAVKDWESGSGSAQSICRGIADKAEDAFTRPIAVGCADALWRWMRANGHRANHLAIYHQAQAWITEARGGALDDGWHPPTALIGWLNRTDWSRC